MSQTAGIACLTCREHGPLVGDYGYLGLPGIEPLRVSTASGGDEGMPSFGFLYEGLAAVGLQRFDLDECAAWLRRHAGHRLALDVEGNNDEVVELEEDETVGEAAEKLWEGAEERLKAALKSGEYRLARHKVACPGCKVDLVSSEPEPFRAFQPRTLGKEQAGQFLERWGQTDDCWTYRLYGAVDPFEGYMQAVIPFVEKHAEHGLVVELTAA
jgi:hypothetical protein